MVFPSAGLTAVPDKGSIFKIESNGDDLTWWTSTVALVPADKTYPAGVPGHYITIDTKMHSISAPMRVECSLGLGDFNILAFKVIGNLTYAVGIPTETLIQWNEKGKEDASLELKLLSSRKLPHENFASLHAFTNTETHKLVEKADKLITKLPLFALAKIKSIKDLKDLSSATNDGIANMRRAVDTFQLKLCKDAAGRGRATGDDGDSRAGARDARKEAGKIRDKLLEHSKFYSEFGIEERFILLKTSEGKVTEETVEEACATIDRFSLPMHARILEPQSTLCISLVSAPRACARAV